MYCIILIKWEKIIHDNKHTETTDNTIKTLFTIHNYLTFTASYMYIEPHAAAEARKDKYALLSRSHHFVPIAIETSGALGPDALSFAHRYQQASAEHHT